jgi:hypothetical protein
MTSRVPLAVYLDGLAAFLRRYVVFPSEHEPVAVGLWVAHCRVALKFETSPYLIVTSAEMRSGKTRLLECLEQLVPNPLKLVTPSAASVYTALSMRPPYTLLFDELDAIFGRGTGERYEEVRGILNAGNRRDAYVLRVRMVGQQRTIEKFDPYGPKALAGIGKLPDTVTDRGIPIRMKRRAPGESVVKFRRRVARAEAANVGEPLWPDELPAEAEVPDALNDRAAEAWEPLLAIADAAGGAWPLRARAAALAVSADEDREVSIGMRLLADIQAAFAGRDHVPTADLLTDLHAVEDGPWGEWYGKPLTARGLARMLEPYGVRPTNTRLAGVMTRGYWRADLEDAWSRYVGASAPPELVSTVASVSAPSAKDQARPLPDSDETDASVSNSLPDAPMQAPETDATHETLSGGSAGQSHGLRHPALKDESARPGAKQETVVTGPSTDSSVVRWPRLTCHACGEFIEPEQLAMRDGFFCHTTCPEVSAVTAEEDRYLPRDLLDPEGVIEWTRYGE